MKQTIYNCLVYVIILVLWINNSTQAQNAIKTDFKPSGSLWGYVFGDLAYKVHSDTLGRAPVGSPYGLNSLNAKNQNLNDANSFLIRRMYLGYDYNISPTFTAQIMVAHEMNIDGNGYNTFYLKYALIRWNNIFHGSNLIIGQMPTSSFATPYGTEPLWGYRSVEKTLIDLHSIDPSTDMGVMLIGNLWKQNLADSLHPSTIGYNLMLANGTGAKPETDRFKKVRANVYVNTMQQKLTLGVYTDYNRLQLSPYHKNNFTFKGYAHYKSDGFKIGAEFFSLTNSNGDIFKTSPTAALDTANGIQFGWSVFLSGRLVKGKLNYLLRMDNYNPDTKYNKNYIYTSSAFGGNMTTTTFFSQRFYLIGLDYTPVPRIHIMPNLWYTRYKSMMDNDAAGNPLSSKVKNNFDFVPRITFFWIFNPSKNVTNNGMDI